MTRRLAVTPPTIGRIVHYRLTEQDARDASALDASPEMRAGDVLPAIIVGVFAAYRSVDAPPVCDLQVFLNGPGQMWRQGISELPASEDGTGQWFWPPRIDMTREGR